MALLVLAARLAPARSVTGWRPCSGQSAGSEIRRVLGARPIGGGALFFVAGEGRDVLEPNRTAVLLTVFRKTRMREEVEVRRAKLAQKACEAEHGPAHEEFVRIIEEGEAERGREMSHRRWKTPRERKLAEGFTESEDVAETRREIRLSMALAKAVYDRRTELGLTQTELADRAGLTQAKISRIEGSDTAPPRQACQGSGRIPRHHPGQRRHPSDLHRASR